MTVSNTKRSPIPLLARSSGRPLAVLVLALGLLAGSSPSPAAEITWFAGNGSWSTASNWWPNQVPAAGDLVWVKAPNGAAVWVGYASATGPQLGTVHFDSVGSGVSIVGISQDLLHAGQHNIGLTGHGVMAASGGTHQVADLNLGFWGSAHGEYFMNPGGVLIANRVFVGVGGRGELTQTGGSATVAGDLSIGHLGGSVGTVDLSGASQLSAAKLFIGNAGNGTMRHSAVALAIPGEINLGLWGGAVGRYEIRDGGSVSGGKLNVGGWGRGTLVQEGAGIDVAGDIVVGFWGSGNGSWELSGPSTVAGQNLFVGGAGVGTVDQQDGDVTVRGDLVLANVGGSNGRYDMGGGSVAANRALVGSWGIGHVEQTSGAVDIAGLMQIGIWGSGRGTYALSGDGTLEVGTLLLGGFGIGHFVQSGGSTIVYGPVRVAELPNSHSSLSLSGGAFDATSLWNKADGDLEFTGGSLAAGNLVNDGVFHLSGEGLRIVESPVTNNGRIESFETTAVFPEPFAHAGHYESTDSLNAFSDLTVSGGGTVVADGTSHFTVSGDLRLDQPGPAWDTTLATLHFVGGGGGTHLLRHAGLDLGPSPDGYVGNFAWRELALDPGESLVLEGGALYVRVLDLPDGLSQLAAISSNGQNIYYDEDDPANAYLGGQTHALGGSGEAIPVPEPSMWLGLGAGLLLLSRLPRRGRA